MKRIINMNALKKVFIGVGIVMVLLACNQPFKAGLGKVVDFQPPTVTLEFPIAGAYIYGEAWPFWGLAEDDYKLDSVYLMVSGHAGLKKDADGAWFVDDWKEYKQVKLELESNQKGRWNCSIDTTVYNDGDFRIKLKVIDSTGKTYETDEMAFFIKNERPHIRMALPSITEYVPDPDKEPMDGQAGGNHLNFKAGNELLSSWFPRYLGVNNTMIGMLTDSEGIYTGPWDRESVPEKFPPQYRIWEVNVDPSNPMSQLPCYQPGYLPTLAELDWTNFTGDNLIQMGLNNYQVSIDLDETLFSPGSYYGFEIRAQSNDEEGNSFRYPRDCWLNVDWSDEPIVANEFQAENRFVLIFIRVPQEEPYIELYGLEDLEAEPVDEIYPDIVLGDSEKEGDYRYVDVSPAFKSGDFTLRIKAKHTEEIQSAEVYWEREDRSERGRFIWDPRADANAAINPRMMYSEWGKKDLSDTTARSFIFSYQHDINGAGLNKLPLDPSYHQQVSGKSKVQRYKGPMDPVSPGSPAWNVSNKLTNKWPEADSMDAYWEEIDFLSEGTYIFEVWARSKTYTDTSNPRSFTLTIDTSPPEVEVNSIDGGDEYQLTTAELAALVNKPTANVPVFIVNGVVKPNFIMSDSRMTDSGQRTGISDYFINNGQHQLEQMYVLFREDSAGANKQLLEAAIAEAKGKWWPINPLANTVDISTAPLEYLKHDPVFGSSVSFKTSPIFASAEELDDGPDGLNYLAAIASELAGAADVLADRPLEDGFYWIYVFSRDKAYNVGYNTALIKVDFRSDFPVYDFAVGVTTRDVLDPNIDADYPYSSERAGFVVENSTYPGRRTVRNKLRTTDAIKFTIEDDDNLDLSELKVSFVAAYTDPADLDTTGNNKIKPYEFVMNIPRSEMNITPNVAFTKKATVTINQSVLLELLKEAADTIPEYDALFLRAKDLYSGLPDGFYKIDFSIADYVPSKFPDTVSNAVSVEQKCFFWVAVDSTRPQIVPGSVIPPSGAYIDRLATTITGKVIDTTGPIYYVPGTLQVLIADPDDSLTSPTATFVGLTENSPTDADFEIVLSMNDYTGATVEAQFTDRFDNAVILSLSYIADDTPPEVSILGKGISTFSRDTTDVRDWISVNQPGIVNPSGLDTNLGRLANGVVHFRISATDDTSGVANVRWWLLPANAVFPTPTLDPGDSGYNAEVKDIYDFTITTQGGIQGEIDMDIPSNAYSNKGFDRWDVYLNSADLAPANGEYCLYLAAIDKAGNVAIPAVHSTVFFLQEEDKPMFGDISPNNAKVGKSGLKIKGMIYDDDGFVHPALTITVTPTTGPVNVQVKEEHYSIIGKNISLNIDLNDTDYGFDFSEGPQSYTITATDKTGKNIVPGDYRLNGDPRDLSLGDPINPELAVSRTGGPYTFEYHTQPPVITLDDTINKQNQTYGPNANDPLAGTKEFKLKGTISDAYLKLNANGKVDIKFSIPVIDNGVRVNKTGTFETAAPVAGTAGFELSGADFTELLGFFDSMLEPGGHTISFSAEDEAGNVGYTTLTFRKDLDPPKIDFTNIDMVELPDNITGLNIGYWWDNETGLSDNIWYTNKHNWLADTDNIPADKVINITYNRGSLPSIRGTIIDEESDIDGTEFYYWIDGATVPVNLLPTVSGKNARWRLFLTTDGTQNTAALPDGIHTVRIQVADIVGNVLAADIMYVFRIISKAPETIVFDFDPGKTPADNSVFGKASSFTAGTPPLVFTVYGTAESANLQDVHLKLVEQTNPDKDIQATLPRDIVETWLFADNIGIFTNLGWTFDNSSGTLMEQLNWSYSVSTALYAGATFRDQSTYDIIVTAVDQAGNESPMEATWTFVKDELEPVIDFSGGLLFIPKEDTHTGIKPDPLDAVLNPLVSGFRGNVLYADGSTEIILSGSAIDTASNISELEGRIEQWDYLTSAWYSGVYNGTAWVPKGWGDTDYNPSSPAQQIQDVYWAWNLGELQEGLYRVQLRAKDSAYTPNTDDTSYTTSRRNPVYSDYVYFYADQGEPTISYSTGEVSTVAGYFSFSGVPIPYSGFAQDSNGLRQIEVIAYNSAFWETRPGGRPAPDAIADSPEGNFIKDALVLTLGSQSSFNTPWSLVLEPIAPYNYLEGNYELEIVAYDMAGKMAIIRDSFLVDNTPPNGSVEEPAARSKTSYPLGDTVRNPLRDSDQYNYSFIVNGGQEYIMNGTFDDGDTGYESGVEGVWFHLGYIPGSNPSNWITDFPTQDQIEATIVPAGAETTNQTLNRLAGDANNSWFKLERGAALPLNMEFANPNLYGWRIRVKDEMDSGGFKYYVMDNIDIKTGAGALHYNGSNPNKLVLPVPEAANAASPGIWQPGIYSMPVWFRVVDKVGNEAYFCHDIWIYPFGDIPTSSIDNPSNASKDAPRGGSINVNGIANDLKSVHSVIFRVFADAVPDTLALKDYSPPKDYYDVTSASTVRPIVSPLTTLSGVTPVASGSAEMVKLLEKTAEPSYYDTSGWYYGVVAKNDQNTPSAQWNFNLNAEGELSSLILTNGFNNETGSYSVSPPNDRIRIWMEVFVFNGKGDPIDTTHIDCTVNEMSLGDGPQDMGAALVYEPYIRAFYLSDSYPVIIDKRVSNDNEEIDYETSITTLTAGQEFTIEANFNSNHSEGLSRVQIRRPSDDRVPANRDWIDVWKDGSIVMGSDGKPVITGVNIDQTSTSGNIVYSFKYDFDSWMTETVARAAYPGTNIGTVNNGYWDELGGEYMVDVRIWDKNNPPSMDEYTFIIGIDNFAPLSVYTRNPKLAGSDERFIGKIFDYTGEAGDPEPVERGLDRVVVWLSKDIAGNEFVPFDKSITGQPARSGSVPAYIGRTATFDDVGTVEVFMGEKGTRLSNVVRHPVLGAGNNWIREISRSTHGQAGARWLSQNSQYDDYVEWQLMIDSTMLKDGALWLNYLVYDKTGNATFCQEQFMVMNNYPRITDITLFTSNYGDGTVEGAYEDRSNVDELTAANVDRKKYDIVRARELNELSEGYLDSEFISKNEYVGFKVETLYGNDRLHYRLQHVTRSVALPLNAAALTDMQANSGAGSTGINLYTIAEPGGFSGWEKLGAQKGRTGKGDHFVFDPEAAITVDLTSATASYYYRYTQVSTLIRETPPQGKLKDANDLNPPILPNWPYDEALLANTTDPNYPNYTQTPADTGDGFNFYGSDFGAGKIAESDDAYFLIRVWDRVDDRWTWNSTAQEWDWDGYIWDDTSEAWVEDTDTSPIAPEKGMLYDAVLIRLKVLLTDTVAPQIKIYDLNPYTETAVTGNNLGTVDGLPTGTPNRDITIRNALDPIGLGPMPSSNVYMDGANGPNFDRGGLYNARTDRELYSSGHIEPRTGSTFTLKAIDGSSYTQVVGTNDKVSGAIILRGRATDDQLISKITVTQGATTFSILELDTIDHKLKPVAGQHAWVYDRLHWRDGHTVEWAWLWDTETWPGNPQNGVTIQVRAVDDRGAAGGNLSAIAPKTVDVQPYISGFARETPKYTTKRSLQGWYSFFQGESNITVEGYNLNLPAAVLTLNDGGTPLNLIKTASAPYTFSIPNAAQSGKITLTAGAFSAMNNTSNTAWSWNREYYVRTPGSEYWNNQPHAHIWRSQQETTGMPAEPMTYFGYDSDWGGSRDSKEPAMTLVYNGDNAGRLYGAWVSDLTRGVHHSLNNNSPRENVEYLSSIPYNGVDISYYHDSDITNNHVNIAYNYMNAGAANIWARDKANDASGISILPTKRNDISGSQTGTPTDRWKSISIARAKTTNISSFYDTYNRRLMFSLSYYADQEDRQRYVSDIITGIDGNGANATATGAAVVNNAGLYNAVDYTTGTNNAADPIIAYYDQYNDTVRLAYSNATENLKSSYIQYNHHQGVNSPAAFNGSHAYEFNSMQGLYHGLKMGDRVIVAPTVDAQDEPVANTGTLCEVVGIGFYARQGNNYFFLDTNGGDAIILRVVNTNGSLGDFYTTDGTPISDNANGSSVHTGLAAGTRWYKVGDKTKILSATLGSWTRRSLQDTTGLLDPNGLFKNAGTHISMKVDNANGVHLAFLNTRLNALIYAYAPSRTANFTVEKVASIDNGVAKNDVIQGAIRIDLSLDDAGNPYIVYGDNSRIGSYDGVRMAYKGKSTDVFGAQWETVQMPAPYQINNDRLNIEAWPPNNRAPLNATVAGAWNSFAGGGWNAAIGYASDQFRIAYFYKPKPGSL